MTGMTVRRLNRLNDILGTICHMMLIWQKRDFFNLYKAVKHNNYYKYRIPPQCPPPPAEILETKDTVDYLMK